MTLINEAERIAQELVEAIDWFPQPTRLEREAAALIRSQAADIERLRKAMVKAHNSRSVWICQTVIREALENKHD